MNLQYSDISSQVGLHENHFASQTDAFASRIHFQSNNLVDKLGQAIIPQVMNETCRYQLNTTLHNFDSMIKYNNMYINAKSDAATNHVDCFKNQTMAHSDKKVNGSYGHQTLESKISHKNAFKHNNECYKFPSSSGSGTDKAASNVSALSNAAKSKFMVDVGTMTDPLTPEEQERLCQWEGFAAVQSGNKVAEYLTGLRDFLKVSISVGHSYRLP